MKLNNMESILWYKIPLILLLIKNDKVFITVDLVKQLALPSNHKLLFWN